MTVAQAFLPATVGRPCPAGVSAKCHIRHGCFDIENVPSILETLRLTLAALRLTLAALRSTLVALRSTLAALRSTLAALRSTLAALRSTLAALRSTLAALRLTLAALRLTLAARRLTLAARRSTLAALHSTLAASRLTLAALHFERRGSRVRPSFVVCLQTIEKAITCEGTPGPLRCLLSYSHQFRRGKRRRFTRSRGDAEERLRGLRVSA